jgi:hypothetical protein
VTPRLLADENTSRRLVSACRQIDPRFPLIHLADWKKGASLSAQDPALLMALLEANPILVGFDRASLPLHAGTLTREERGLHAGSFAPKSVSNLGLATNQMRAAMGKLAEPGNQLRAVGGRTVS